MDSVLSGTIFLAIFCRVHMFRIKIAIEYLLGLQRAQAVNYSKGSQFTYKIFSEVVLV